MFDRFPFTIISGGQTGVDQIALLAAFDCRVRTDGTAPREYMTERGKQPLLRHFGLRDIGYSYADRTKRNIVDSDGTLIILGEKSSPGTRLTQNICAVQRKPYLVIPETEVTNPVRLDETLHWLERHDIRFLNVAGPRASNLKQGSDYHIYMFLVRTFVGHLGASPVLATWDVRGPWIAGTPYKRSLNKEFLVSSIDEKLLKKRAEEWKSK